MKGLHGHAELRHVLGVRHAQSVLAHVVDMRGPGIDEGHVFTALHHMSAGVSADRASSDNGYLAAHDFHPPPLGSDTRIADHLRPFWHVGPNPRFDLIWRHGSRLVRSEEHTSELQSLRHLVCRLLLEKKK